MVELHMTSNTSSLTDGLNQNTGSFEVFLNYKIKQKSKIKQFNNIVEVYDKNTKKTINCCGKLSK